MSETPRMTRAEWLAEGERRFGKDMLKWQFVCPICKGIQTPEDFRQYKDRGATPDSAYFNCIGRYQPDTPKALGDSKPTPETRCDYTLGGLIRLSGVIVTDDEGKEHHCFAFAGVGA